MGSVAGLVDKATSDLLIGPDWTMNLEICDIVNTDHGQAKDVIKAVKKRIAHKNPRVQLLALTLLETLIKNCGEIVHFQVAERNILQEMVKIVRKKSLNKIQLFQFIGQGVLQHFNQIEPSSVTDMQVRDKILVLLDAWQEAFGGPRGKYPQYFWAYDELRCTGVEFPERIEKTAPIFTPPPTHSRMELSQPGYGMPSHIASRLDEAMASEMPQLSLSDMEAAHGAMEVLAEMLRAVDSKNKNAVKDEVIVDLVEQCRSTQRRVLQLVNTTSDEELLRQGLVLNDDLQNVLARHDAIASGSPLPPEPVTSGSNVPSASAPYEEDEPEDDFSKLARRPSRIRGTDQLDDATQSSLTGQLALPAPEDVTDHNNQLDLPEPPQPIKTANVPNHEQQLIDLFSGDLSGDLPPQTPATPPPVIASNGHPVSPLASQPQSPLASQPQTPGNSYASNTFQQQHQVYSNGSMYQQQPFYSAGSTFNTPPFSYQHGYQTPQQYSPYSGSQYQNYSWNQPQLVQNSYVVPWATGFRQTQPPNVSGNYSSPSQVSQVTPNYPPPPWTSSSLESASQSISPQQRAMLYGNSTAPTSSSPSQHSPRTTPVLQQQRLFSSPSERPTISGEQQRDLVGNMQNMSLRGNIVRQASSIGSPSSPRPYMPADRLFGDLIDLKSVNTNFKTTKMSQNPSKEGNSKEGTI